MLIDMNPGGQYGEYLNSATNQMDFSSFPLSIYNTSNLLPNTNASWRNPIFENISFYMDDNGDSSKIYLNQNASGNWIPQPLNSSHIKHDLSNNTYYIYPEELNKNIRIL
jgi:hypothetical protein